MYDYEMLNETLEISEGLLKNLKEDHSKYIADLGKNIKTQICDSIYRRLSAAKFPYIHDITVSVPRMGEVVLSSGRYIVNKKDYKYQLFIRNCDKVSRIYFDMGTCYEREEQPLEKDTMIVLINAWDQIKKMLYLRIEEAYRARVERVKTEINTVESEREIFENFIP